MGRIVGMAMVVMLAAAMPGGCRVLAQPVDPAEAAFRRGDYTKALELVRGSTRQALLRGLVAEERGERDAARKEFSALCGSAGRLRSAADLANAGEACQRLGKLHDANEVFKRAAEADQKDADVRVRWGRLFLRAHNAAEAHTLFEEALKLDETHPGALTGAAEVLSDRWDSGADKYIESALKHDPEFVPAHLVAARMALEEEQAERATMHITRALALQPRSLPAFALRAAVAYQRGDMTAMEKDVAEALRLNPRYGEVYEPIGHAAKLQRQFAAAADFYAKAVKVDPELWSLHAQHGLALFRLGRDEEARRALEIAFKGDTLADSYTKNTLRLMDSFDRYDRFETPHFRIKLHQKESAALRPYVEELLERSLTSMAERYKFMPSEKVGFEMFPDHDDFAVRTLGLPGLGALGASFGGIVAMDSPAARPQGTFHWGSTLWHEVAHVITLQATNNRVPRWFTEGLSVYEEHRAGWGDRLDLNIIAALKEKRLMSIAELNSGFVRPRWPGQVVFAYWQGGMLCRYIAEKHGFDKILGLLKAFREGEKTEPAVARVLGRPLEALDKDFRAWLDPQVEPLMRAVDPAWAKPRKRDELEAEVAKRPENFFARLQLAAMLKQEKKSAEALLHAQAARDLFPYAVEHGSPYEIAADILLESGKREEGVAELLKWFRAGGMNAATGRRLAGLLVELGHPKEAIEVLEGFLYIAPLEADLHRMLGEQYMAQQRGDVAAREFAAVLALNPVDPAQAHFDLARAYAAAKRHGDAKKQVLAALEIAPGFSPAQKLLLELSQ